MRSSTASLLLGCLCTAGLAVGCDGVLSGTEGTSEEPAGHWSHHPRPHFGWSAAPTPRSDLGVPAPDPTPGRDLGVPAQSDLGVPAAGDLGVPALPADASPPPPASSGAHRLFASNFGPGVSLGKPSGFSGASQVFIYTPITGTDSSTGYTWPATGFWGDPECRLERLLFGATPTPTATNFSSFEADAIENVIGPGGVPTTALKLDMVSQGGTSSQASLQINPRNGPKQVYISEWMKLQPGLVDTLAVGGEHNWRDIFQAFGWSDSLGEAWRMLITLSRGSDGVMRHEVKTDMSPNSAGDVIWSFSGPNKIPIGSWFKLEIFIRRTGDWNVNGGRVLVKVTPDGGSPVVLCDANSTSVPAAGYSNSSMMDPSNTPLNTLKINNPYQGGTFPAYQWCTGLELWDDIP